jgi:hypothetical protein
MKRFSESSEEGLKWPTEKGWYWVLINGYRTPTPCWFSPRRDPEDEPYFLPGGMGDGSSMGLYEDDIKIIGPEIIEPKFF